MMKTKKTAEPKTYTVLLQTWTEYERGWGQRPDGQTLHLTREDRDMYVTGYDLEYNNKSEVPDEYTKADPNPVPVTIGAALYWVLVKHLEKDAAKEWMKRGMHVERKDIAASLGTT